MTFAKRRKIIKTFVKNQISYWQLVRTFCQRQTSLQINHLHERALTTVYNDEVSPFSELLQKERSGTIHKINIKYQLQSYLKLKAIS